MINDDICLIHLHIPKPRFLNLTTIDVLGYIILRRGGTSRTL